MGKATISRLKTKEFQPFKLKIEVTTEEEAKLLWHMFNASIDRIVSTKEGLEEMYDLNSSLCSVFYFKRDIFEVISKELEQ